VLSLWTWNLKASEIIPEYTSNWYSGPAMKIGAGVIVGEANTIAHASGYHVVGGECGSVGLAAGYTQGGGHSMLNTAYGMAADQVLEWEVVTPQGELLIATPEKNSDLYWALSGGGGGTFGVVLSMTARIYPEVAVAGGQLSFQNTNETSFWKGVSLWFGHSRALANDNNTIIFLVHHDHFQVVAMTLPGQPETAVSDLLSPVLSELESLGIEYRFNTLSSSSYFEHFKTHFGPLPYGPNPPSTILINRIIPEAVVQSETSNAEWMSAVRSTVAGGDFLVGCAIMLVGNATHPPNAVLPAWRKTSVSCNVNAYWNYRAPLSTNLELKRRLVEEHMPALEAATPGGGVYLNEMDPWYKGDWKANLYGDNYDRLLDIKHRVDPDFLFWGNFSVASDERVLHGNGRLCKV
jgi:FAD/FMN-containing dehydrogenase